MIAWKLYGVNNADVVDIPGRVDAHTDRDFLRQFTSILDTEPARTHERVMYLWLSEKPVPRVRGKSRILYVGKTDGSMRSRLRKWARVESTRNNWLRYAYIIKRYGPKTFKCVPCRGKAGTPREAEKRILQKYFQVHLERPPINSSQ